MAKPGPTTILSRNKPRLVKYASGFTLVEILLVLAIISAVMSLGLPAISRVTYQRVNSTTRKFVGLVRTVRNDAVLLNSVYRLAIDMEKQTWWVEIKKDQTLISEVTEKTKKKKKGDDEPKSDFSFAEKFSKKPVQMPGGVVIEGVMKEREGLVKEGIVYIHFFPNGFNDQAILYVNKEGAESAGYSVLIRPTSGRVEIFRERLKGFDTET